VLVAYSKITMKRELLASKLPDEAWFSRALRGYFPHEIIDRYESRLPDHPLRREIVVTRVVNDFVNRGGITFGFRAQEESGAGLPEVARAYTVMREVFGFARYWRDIEALDGKVPTKAQTALYLDGRRLLDRSVRWLLHTRRAAVDVEGEIQRFSSTVRALSPMVPELLRGAEQQRLRTRAAEVEELGAPADLALQAAGLLDVFSLLEVTEIARATEAPPERVAEVYFALSERYEVDQILTRITHLPRADRWQALARASLRYDLYSALADLTRNVLAVEGPNDAPVDQQILAWEEANAEGLARARTTLDDIAATEQVDLAALSVALRTIRTLVRT
jgi:glutamate dehydrogenase